jgi:hypothetical protein
MLVARLNSYAIGNSNRKLLCVMGLSLVVVHEANCVQLDAEHVIQ